MDSLNITDALITIGITKEAEASIALDQDSELVTRAEGLTNNPKLYRYIITVKNINTDEIIWKGPLANMTRSLGNKIYQKNK